MTKTRKSAREIRIRTKYKEQHDIKVLKENIKYIWETVDAIRTNMNILSWHINPPAMVR